MTTPRPALAFEREGPLVTVGLIWVSESGRLRRWLVRRHRWSGRSVTSELTHVARDTPFCPRCLTSNVWVQRGTFQPSEGADIGTDWSDCLDCGLSWWLVPEPSSLAGE